MPWPLLSADQCRHLGAGAPLTTLSGPGEYLAATMYCLQTLGTGFYTYLQSKQLLQEALGFFLPN